MSRLVIALDKYSDWLEAYSCIHYNPDCDVEVHYLANNRNDGESIRGVFNNIVSNEKGVHFFQHEDKMLMFNKLKQVASQLKAGDFLIAPFVRYRHFWQLTALVKNGVTTVHISECLPDTFGHVGYRLGFRGNKLKTWLTLPFAKLYAVKHVPDICYFPLASYLSNPFVKKTLPVVVPALSNAKQEVLASLMGGEKRVLLIGGFGYDVKKMASELSLDKYIATSKGIEIIVDGIVYPLSQRICAEEVLLSGMVAGIAGYTSSAIVWGKLLYPSMNIECFKAEHFDRQYGPFYSFLAARSLKKMGITVKPENKRMLE